MMDDLSPEECREAERRWWKRSQMDSFGEDIALLKEGKGLGSSSRLRKLSPFVDLEGILRVRGRTSVSEELGYGTKNPIILDPKHKFTRLLLQHHHELAGHHGQEMVANELRQRYWILDLRAAVRSTWSSCQDCRVRRCQPGVMEMAPLPEVRVTQPSRPFTWIGMDYFGPLWVTIGRRHEKRYGVLFTCLSTWAIHVELAESLSTDSCIMAIRRMGGRRGYPEKIYSDNGTNHHGADNELKKSLEELNQQRMIQEMTVRGIEWHFIPPSAPHMGGAWERLVKSVKVALLCCPR